MQDIAHKAMIERGLLPDFSAAALAELDRIQAPAGENDEPVRDLTDLLWASIDNDDSLDLDQLTVAETLPGDKVKIRVAVADVDALVKNGSGIDQHARHNTASVYTCLLYTSVPVMSFFANQAAMAIEHARLQEQAEQLAVLGAVSYTHLIL